MSRARWMGLALTISALIAAASTEAHAAPPIAEVHVPFERFTLPNGLVVILAEDHRAPVVGWSLHFRAGSRHDPPGRRGIASLLRRIYADEPSARFDADARAALFAALHLSLAKVQSEYNRDCVWLHSEVPARALPLALWMEADRLAHAAEGVTTAAITKAREALGPETLLRTLARATLGALYGEAHPYGGISHGPPELDAVTPDEVRAALRASFIPSNAVLALTGDFVPARAKELVTRYFATIPAGPRPARAPVPPAQLSGVRRMQVAADVPAPQVLVTWPAPALYTNDDTLLDQVATLLGQRLVVRHGGPTGLASEVWSHEASSNHGSVFQVRLALRPGRGVAEALAAIDAEIAALASIGEDDARASKLEWLRRVLIPLDVPANRAVALGAGELGAGEPASAVRRVAVHRDATAADLRRVAASTLRPDRRVIVEVVPTRGAPAIGRIVSGRAP